jgi:hypothetical protein
VLPPSKSRAGFMDQSTKGVWDAGLAPVEERSPQRRTKAAPTARRADAVQVAARLADEDESCAAWFWPGVPDADAAEELGAAVELADEAPVVVAWVKRLAEVKVEHWDEAGTAAT